MSEKWNVIIEKAKCPYKLPEMEDYVWYDVCILLTNKKDTTRKGKCNIVDCPKKKDNITSKPSNFYYCQDCERELTGEEYMLHNSDHWIEKREKEVEKNGMQI